MVHTHGVPSVSYLWRTDLVCYVYVYIRVAHQASAPWVTCYQCLVSRGAWPCTMVTKIGVPRVNFSVLVCLGTS
jgi:hypothetical protein